MWGILKQIESLRDIVEHREAIREGTLLQYLGGIQRKPACRNYKQRKNF